ncbi:hypothetical protein LCB40_13040 [Lactobacillus corticis]|uniref:Uncharacterized protein n=1 Tax=Lactobacillus corticis TaxID=2201249 RepID=A0A916QHH9_9LACO|nr:hypothetical protein LCB40_13040 [Lactobacillus corticis]
MSNVVITYSVGTLLFFTGFFSKKWFGKFDWLYTILGFLIIVVGVLKNNGGG